MARQIADGLGADGWPLSDMDAPDCDSEAWAWR